MSKEFKVVMLFIIAAAFSSCISCAGFQAVEIGPVDPAFDKYIDAYKNAKAKEIGKGFTKNVSVQFYSLGGNIIGICYWYSSGDRKVYIDPEFWYGPFTTEKDRELLIAHELGHCDLDRPHTDPSSIMEQYHIGGFEFNKNKEYYYSELFNPSKRVELTTTYEKFKFHKDSNCGGVVKDHEHD